MRASSWLGLVLSVALCGCAGYRLGPTNGVVAGTRSVQVNLFRNDTPEPRLRESVAGALRQRLQQDGTYHLATHGDGDIVVNGVIQRYERSPVSFQPTDVITVQDYSVSMFARVIAVERATGHTNLNRIVEAKTTLRAGNDLASAERQALPLLAADLARIVTGWLVDGTW